MKTGSIIFGYLVLFGFYQLPEYVRNETGSIAAFLGLVGLFVLVAHLVLRWQGERGLASVGLAVTSLSARQLLLGVLLHGFLSGLAFGVCYRLGLTRITFVPSLGQFALQLLVFVVGTFLPSLAEDVLTRGYVYRHWGHRVSFRLFVAVSTLLYVLNHVYRLQNGPTTWVFLTVVGISLAIPLVMTRSLWLTLGMHWGNNIVYQLTNNVLHSDDVPGFSSTWVLTGCIMIMTALLPMLIKRLDLVQQVPRESASLPAYQPLS